MKYKVTNKLEQAVWLDDILFNPKETKIIGKRPYSDSFDVEEIIEQPEEPRKIMKGGKRKTK